MDYGFFTDSADKDHQAEKRHRTRGATDEAHSSYTPILVIRDKKYKAIFSDVVRCKGSQDPYGLTLAVKHIERCGYPEIMLRTDGEPAIRSFRDAVKVELLKKGIRVIPNATPKADSAGAGTAESAVKLIKDKTSTLICWAKELHGVTMSSSHNNLAWAVQYAGQLIFRSHRGDDGLTAWQRHTGKREVPRKYAPWGEKILWLEGSKKKVQVSEKWHDGIFLGLVDETEEAIVGTPNGCFKARSIRRRPAEECRDPLFFNSVVGLPWKLQPGSPDGAEQVDAPVALKLDVQPAEIELPRVYPSARGPSRVYIRASVELKKYGFTTGCLGCDAVQLGTAQRPHNEECRARIIKRMAEDPELLHRVLEAELRKVVVDEAAQDASAAAAPPPGEEDAATSAETTAVGTRAADPDEAMNDQVRPLPSLREAPMDTDIRRLVPSVTPATGLLSSLDWKRHLKGHLRNLVWMF